MAVVSHERPCTSDKTRALLGPMLGLSGQELGLVLSDLGTG